MTEMLLTDKKYLKGTMESRNWCVARERYADSRWLVPDTSISKIEKNQFKRVLKLIKCALETSYLMGYNNKFNKQNFSITFTFQNHQRETSLFR